MSRNDPTNSARTHGMAKRKSRRHRRRSGILWLIAICLIASTLLRIGGVGGFAIAEGLAGLTGAEDASETTTEVPPDIATVLSMLQDREARLKVREEVLADREQAIAIAEDQVRKNLDALAQAEKDLERMIALSSRAAEDDLSRLTSVYENMKPKQAALVFSEMPPEFAAGFLGRMRADAAAAVMAGLPPDKAYAISVLLAGRNAAAPTE